MPSTDPMIQTGNSTYQSIYNSNSNDHCMLDESIDRAKRGYYKLVILVGPAGSGKTDMMLRLNAKKGYPYVNLNLELSRNLIDMPIEERPSYIQECIETLLAPAADVILLDNTELVFSPQLQIDPLRLFHALSRKRTVVISWNGTYNKNTLIYAEPNHSEYRTYTTQEVDAEIYPLHKEMVI